jgi:hypothetical protein
LTLQANSLHAYYDFQSQLSTNLLLFRGWSPNCDFTGRIKMTRPKKPGPFEHLAVGCGFGLPLVILQDVVAGDGVAEYGSEEDIGGEVSPQADARKANGSR